MAGFPALVLVGFTVLIWVTRNRHIRTIWILTLTSFFLAWISTIILSRFPSGVFMLSNWNIGTFLESGIKIEFGTNSIALLNSVLMLGLVIPLRIEGYEETIRSKGFITMCILGSLCVVTTLSGNFITFAFMWVLWESALVLIQSNAVPGINGGNLGTGFFLRLISVPLALAVGVMLSTSTDINPSIVHNGSQWIFILGVVTVLVRFSIFRDFRHDPLESISEQSGAIWLQGSTIIPGFAFLNKVFHAITLPPDATLFIGVGMIVAFTGIGRTILNSGRKSYTDGIALALLGMGILLHVAPGVTRSGHLYIMGVMVMVTYAIALMTISKNRWSIAATIAAGLILIGAPGSISAVIVENFLEAFGGKWGYLIGLPGVLVLVVIAGKILHLKRVAISSTNNDRSARQIGDFAIPLIILTSALAMGFSLGPRISTSSITVFVMLALLTGIASMGWGKMKLNFDIHLPSITLTGKLNALSDILNQFSKWLSALVIAFARIFEGRAGLLWVYVIAQLILVALGITER